MSILVTGANRGLGLQVCRTLVEGGKEVVATAREGSAGESTLAELVTEVVHMDFATEDHTAFNGVLESIRKVDAVVHCASLFKLHPIKDAPLEEIVEYGNFSTNNTLLAKWALNQFSDDEGKFVWIGSVAATAPRHATQTYSQYKAGLMPLSTLIHEDTESKVRSTYINLGAMTEEGSDSSLSELVVTTRIVELLDGASGDMPPILELQKESES